MKINPKIKNIAIFAAVFIAAILVYVYFFKKPATPPLSTSSGAPVTTATAPSTQVGQQFLTLLLNLGTLKLDDSIFSSAAFNNLQDYTITLTPEGNEGRVNPFAPIGVDVQTFSANTSAASSSTSTTSISPTGL